MAITPYKRIYQVKNSFTLFIISMFLFLSCSKPSIFTSTSNSDYILIDFKNLEIVDFIEEIAEITDSEIEIDGEINGKVNFVSNEPILKIELITLLHAILETKRMVDSLDSMLDNRTLVHHVDSGEDGIIYFISCIKEVEKDSMKVIWGYYFNGLGAGEDEAILKKINGEWQIMESHTLWVS